MREDRWQGVYHNKRLLLLLPRFQPLPLTPSAYQMLNQYVQVENIRQDLRTGQRQRTEFSFGASCCESGSVL